MGTVPPSGTMASIGLYGTIWHSIRRIFFLVGSRHWAAPEGGFGPGLEGNRGRRTSAEGSNSGRAARSGPPGKRAQRPPPARWPPSGGRPRSHIRPGFAGLESDPTRAIQGTGSAPAIGWQAAAALLNSGGGGGEGRKSTEGDFTVSRGSRRIHPSRLRRMRRFRLSCYLGRLDGGQKWAGTVDKPGLTAMPRRSIASLSILSEPEPAARLETPSALSDPEKTVFLEAVLSCKSGHFLAFRRLPAGRLFAGRHP